MKPKGQDTADALRNWIKKDIEVGPSSRNRLGQFFFGVSSGTIGLFVGLTSIVSELDIGKSFVISLSTLFFSSAIALYMACPSVIKLTGDTDLFELYTRQIKRIIWFTLFWFGIWILGVVTGIVSLFIDKQIGIPG